MFKGKQHHHLINAVSLIGTAKDQTRNILSLSRGFSRSDDRVQNSTVQTPTRHDTATTGMLLATG
jgi:hypothetical protein